MEMLTHYSNHKRIMYQRMVRESTGEYYYYIEECRYESFDSREAITLPSLMIRSEQNDLEENDPEIDF